MGIQHSNRSIGADERQHHRPQNQRGQDGLVGQFLRTKLKRRLVLGRLVQDLTDLGCLPSLLHLDQNSPRDDHRRGKDRRADPLFRRLRFSRQDVL